MKPIQLFSRTALFLALMILSAYLQITLPTPFFSMHITMQLFTCIVCGFCLPVSYSALCMGVYILIGLAGLPVFASGGGIQYLMKPTFGFILGFLFCSMACSYFRQRKNPTSKKEYYPIFVFVSLPAVFQKLYKYLSSNACHWSAFSFCHLSNVLFACEIICPNSVKKGRMSVCKMTPASLPKRVSVSEALP